MQIIKLTLHKDRMPDNFTGIVEWIDPNGIFFLIESYKDGLIHSFSDQPSYSLTGEVINQDWHKHGYLHRENGPAQTTITKNGKFIIKHYYLEGMEFKTEEAFLFYKKFKNNELNISAERDRISFDPNEFPSSEEFIRIIRMVFNSWKKKYR